MPLSVAVDLHGRTFGRLRVIGRAAHEPRFGSLAAWRCACDCGQEVTVVGRSLRSGSTRSCGCLHDEACSQRATTHGRSGTREYRSWSAAKTRCYNPKAVGFANYGGRGVTMCDRWRQSFDAFVADMGPCPPGHSIDRIDVNGPYAPGNCRWATSIRQANNRRGNHPLTFQGRTFTVAEWEREIGMPSGVLNGRIQRGWPIERALTEPLRKWPSQRKQQQGEQC